MRYSPVFMRFVSNLSLTNFFLSSLCAAHSIVSAAIIVMMQKLCFWLNKLQRSFLIISFLHIKILKFQVSIRMYVFFITDLSQSFLSFISLPGAKLMSIVSNAIIFAASSTSLRQNSTLIPFKTWFIVINRPFRHIHGKLQLNVWQLLGNSKFATGHLITQLEVNSGANWLFLIRFHFGDKFINLSVNKSLEKKLLVLVIGLKIRVKGVKISD